MSSFDNHFPKAESYAGDTFMGVDVTAGVEVVRAGDAGEGGVKACSVLAADNLLENDGHLLFFGVASGRFHIAFGGLEECGSIDPFDGITKLLQADGDVGVVIGQHMG